MKEVIPFPGTLCEGSGVKTVASTALGITDITLGFSAARSAVFSLLRLEKELCYQRISVLVCK